MRTGTGWAGEEIKRGRGRQRDNDGGRAERASDVLEEGSGYWTITFQGKKLPAILGREALAYLAYVLTHLSIPNQ
jgi:hypothetical protein